MAGSRRTVVKAQPHYIPIPYTRMLFAHPTDSTV